MCSERDGSYLDDKGDSIEAIATSSHQQKVKMLEMMCEEILLGLPIEAPERDKNVLKLGPRRKIINVKRNQLLPEDLQNQKREELVKRQNYLENQLNLLGKRLRDDKFPDINLLCKNVASYIKKHETTHNTFYLFCVYYYWIKSKIGMKNVADAENYFKKMDRLTGINEELQIEKAILLGEIKLAAQNHKEAAEIWKQVLSQLKNKERVVFLQHEIGRCFYETGELDESSDFAKECIGSGLQPWTCYSWLLLGQIAIKRDDYRTAFITFGQANSSCQDTCNPVQTTNYIFETMKQLRDILMSKTD